MSWTAVQPAIRPKAVTRDAAIVTISVSKPGRFLQRLFLTVNARLLPELSWWSYSQPVAVEQGSGEHDGRLRLSAGGPFQIMAPTGRYVKTAPASPILQISGLPGMPADGMARRPVAWEIAGDALIVTLPWSDAKGMAKLVPRAPLPVPSAPASPAPPPQKAPALASAAAAYADIERWAIAHGVGTATHGFDLAKVNALRVQRGERPWTIRKSHGGAA